MSPAQQAQATLEARNRREPGTELNDADKACLHQTYETFHTTEDGNCIRYYASNMGVEGCAEHELISVAHTRTHVTNTCKRTLKFHDMCGSSYFGDHDLAPGAEFILRLSAPCYFAY